MKADHPARVDLVLATDAAYSPWAATVVQSCVDNRGAADLRVHILRDVPFGGGAEVSLRRMTEAVALQGVEMRVYDIGREVVAGLPLLDRFPGTAWLRLVVPRVLDRCTRALYLDADTFVVAPLDELFCVDLGDCALAAVANVVEPALRGHIADLGIHAVDGFFNSGVLLLDLDRLRRTGEFDDVARVSIERRGELRWPDQDALNVVFAGQWKHLDPRWNAQNSLWWWRGQAVEVFGDEAVSAAVTDPAVLHFEGPTINKPWHYLCQHPWRERYLATASRTPFGPPTLSDRTPMTRMIRRLPSRYRVEAFARLERWRHRLSEF